MADVLAPTEQELRADFSEAASSPELVSFCQRLCQDYQLSASTLSFEWDLLTMNGGGGKAKRMTLESLSTLEERVSSTQQAKRMKLGEGKGGKGKGKGGGKGGRGGGAPASAEDLDAELDAYRAAK